MIKAIYYYTYKELSDYTPFGKLDCANLIKGALGLENLDYTQVPSNFVTKKVYYDELISLVMGKYRNHAIIKIVKHFNEEPTYEEKMSAYKEWFYNLLALINDTYEYYTKMLDIYASEKSKLMDDIKATSGNKVKFNDTPQNSNVGGTYEGDDYITHFTSTEGETKSELMSKIMRLKEIQDNYKDIMSTWVRDFERIFYVEEI